MIKILVKPQINTTELSVFDSKEDYVIKFIANTGDQVLANEIEIQKIIDNTQIYTDKINSMYLNHTIFANTLQNGEVYRIHLRTYNNQDQYSSWSDWVVLTCFSKPIIDISNIIDNSILNNQNYSFMGSYNQAEGDKLQYYKFILYDYNENIVSESPIIFSQNGIQYKFSGMANNQKYYIELQITTQHNITVSIKKSFTTQYIAPMFTNYITLNNNKEKASVDVQVIAIRTLGHITSGSVVIENGECANCISGNGVIQFDDQNNNGLYFKYNQGNWQLQLWLKGLQDNYIPINKVLEGTAIAIFYSDKILMKLEYYNGMFHLYKYILINNQYKIISHYVSNIINASPSDKVYLFIQSTNDRIQMISSIIDNNNNVVNKSSRIFNKSEEYAGIIKNNNEIILSTEYSPSKRFLIYYGEIASSGILDWSKYSVLICADNNINSIKTVMNSGCKVFQYVYFGSRFENTDEFISNTKQTILNMKNNNIANGIFFDECDITYWKENYTQSDLTIFSNVLQILCNYCRSINLPCVVNGSVGFAKYGDYWLWESFIGTWSNCSAFWQGDGTNPPRREPLDDKAVNYYFDINELRLTGDLTVDTNKNIIGTNGTIELIFDTGQLNIQDKKDIYDWIYVEWWGTGMTNNTVHAIAYEGDSLPYNSSTWIQIPDLSSGEAESWDGIGGKSKYLRIVLTISKATNFVLEKIMIAFQYIYKYYDMNIQPSEKIFNPYEWHWSIAQRDYIWDNVLDTEVLAHTYGEELDKNKALFCYNCALIWGFPMWDYVHPTMQNIYADDMYQVPYGLLLKHIDKNHAIFTGSDIKVNLESHTSDIIINKPNYYYNRTVDMTTGIGFNDNNSIYKNTTQKQRDVWDIVDMNLSSVITDFCITDDIDSFYIKYSTVEPIDFNKNNYTIFFNTNDMNDYSEGYKSEWFSSGFGVNYELCNDSLYVWNNSYSDNTNYQGFKFIKILDSYISNDKKTIIIKLNKKLLNKPMKKIKFFIVVTDNKTYNASIMPNNYHINQTTGLIDIDNVFNYMQSIYNPYVPHGYYCSNIVEFDNIRNSVKISWDENKPNNTDIKIWVRINNGQILTDWFEITNNQIITNNIKKIQYCVGLYTTNGDNTPTISNIKIV